MTQSNKQVWAAQDNRQGTVTMCPTHPFDGFLNRVDLKGILLEYKLFKYIPSHPINGINETMRLFSFI